MIRFVFIFLLFTSYWTRSAVGYPDWKPNVELSPVVKSWACAEPLSRKIADWIQSDLAPSWLRRGVFAGTPSELGHLLKRVGYRGRRLIYLLDSIKTLLGREGLSPFTRKALLLTQDAQEGENLVLCLTSKRCEVSRHSRFHPPGEPSFFFPPLPSEQNERDTSQPLLTAPSPAGIVMTGMWRFRFDNEYLGHVWVSWLAEYLGMAQAYQEFDRWVKTALTDSLYQFAMDRPDGLTGLALIYSITRGSIIHHDVATQFNLGASSEDVEDQARQALRKYPAAMELIRALDIKSLVEFHRLTHRFVTGNRNPEPLLRSYGMHVEQSASFPEGWDLLVESYIKKERVHWPRWEPAQLIAVGDMPANLTTLKKQIEENHGAIYRRSDNLPVTIDSDAQGNPIALVGPVTSNFVEENLLVGLDFWLRLRARKDAQWATYSLYQPHYMALLQDFALSNWSQKPPAQFESLRSAYESGTLTVTQFEGLLHLQTSHWISSVRWAVRFLDHIEYKQKEHLGWLGQAEVKNLIKRLRDDAILFSKIAYYGASTLKDRVIASSQEAALQARLTGQTGAAIQIEATMEKIRELDLFEEIASRVPDDGFESPSDMRFFRVLRRTIFEGRIE